MSLHTSRQLGTGKGDPFWEFSRRMFRYKKLMLAAMICAVISGGSLTGGLVGATPVISAVFGTKRTVLPPLKTQASEWNKNPDHAGKEIPDDVIAQLPERSDESGTRAQALATMAAAWNASPEHAGSQIPTWLVSRLPTTLWSSIFLIVMGLGVLTVVGSTANFLHAYLSLTLVNKTITSIRREAFHRVLRLPLGLVVKSSTGDSQGGATDVISRIVNDTNSLSQGMTALVSKAVSQAVKGIGALVAAFLIDWQMSLGTMIAGPIVFLVINRLGKRIRRYSKKALVSQSELQLAATESLQGLRVVKVHSAERFEAGRFHRINKKVMAELNKVRTARALSSPVVEALSIFVLGTLILVAAKAVFDGHLTSETLIAVLISLGAAGASFKPISGLVNDIQASSGGAERLRELLASTPEPGHDSRLPKLPRHSREIEFRNVNFGYRGSERASLIDINLAIRHGEKVAIVGPNGCGKTTLLSLVPRLFEPDASSKTSGVWIDGNNIRDFNVRSLRRQIGVVTQETVLFKRSVRGNITYGAATGASEELIIEAATRARAHDFICKLPHGYDTEVAEQGSSLSGGQRQRIAIARAILRDPAILILDEATSMIDADSEAQINAAINEFAQGRTTLIVAHRLSTMISADRIVVMDQGRIVDVGRHEELQNRCEVYQLLTRHQRGIN